MLKIGEVVGSHGVRGEFKVYPYTDYPERFQGLELITVQKNGRTRELHVEKVRQHKNLFIFQCQEIKDRNQADELRSWDLVVDFQEAVVLPQGHYYDYQLEGMEVWDLGTETSVGTLVEVLHLPANAVYRVKKPDGGEILIPALKQVIKGVDVAAKRMEIEPLDGLLE